MLHNGRDRALKELIVSSFRTDRISEEVRHTLDAVIRDMNDPRIGGTWCITHADVTRDLRYAKVYVSILEDDRAEGMMQALKKAAGYIRHELGSRMDIRYTPELIFQRDTNIAYGAHIAEMLKNVISEQEEKPND